MVFTEILKQHQGRKIAVLSAHKNTLAPTRSLKLKSLHQDFFLAGDEKVDYFVPYSGISMMFVAPTGILQIQLK